MKPLIGITCGTFRDREWCPPIHGHRQTYIDSIIAAGGAPFLFPLVEDEAVLRALYDRLDGVLLAGGCDVDPIHYGEEPSEKLGVVDELRDRVELTLARWAAEDGKPIFGICRGLQVLNVALGGTLYQDITTDLPTQLVHDDSFICENWAHMAHTIELAPDSVAAQLFGVTEFTTNSLHHQSVKALAPGLRVVGWAPDGVVELIESADDRFMLGVQCHPEALQGDADPRWQGLFRHFVENCRVAV